MPDAQSRRPATAWAAPMSEDLHRIRDMLAALVMVGRRPSSWPPSSSRSAWGSGSPGKPGTASALPARLRMRRWHCCASV
jgi:hypothetical protein